MRGERDFDFWETHGPDPYEHNLDAKWYRWSNRKR